LSWFWTAVLASAAVLWNVSSYSAGGMFPQKECGRSVLYQATHSIVDSVTSVTVFQSPAFAYPDRHFQDVEREVGAEVVCDLPADDPAGIQILNEVYAQPAAVAT